MFSFQQSVDLVFGDINQQDPLVDLQDHVPIAGNIHHQANKGRRKHRDGSSLTNPSSSTANRLGDGKDDHHTNKKLIHREIEKQRRKQMANHYASLRSLLPHEFIKGKRSTPDHVDQAVNYIKYMQENIKILGIKRDQLKNFTAIMSRSTNESSKDLLPNTVKVNRCNGGFEILIDSCSIQDGFLLSRVLETLVEEGLNILSCTSTRANERLIHTILSEVMKLIIEQKAHISASIDPSALHQRLTGVANDRLAQRFSGQDNQTATSGVVMEVAETVIES